MHRSSRSLGVLIALVAAVDAMAEKAYTVPFSNNTVELVLTLPGKPETTIKTLEGGLVRFGDRTRGLGLVAMLRDDGTAVELSLCEIEAVDPDNEAIRVVEQTRVGLEGAVVLATAHLGVRFAAVEMAPLDLPAPVGDKEDCCIFCPDGTYFCACAVRNSCGCCCDAPCCKHWPCGPIAP